jgi:uncharacterized protein with LGFP repeats
VGQFATFAEGAIYWSPDTGARAVLGPIEVFWKSRGAEHGDLGYPTTSVSATADGTGQSATFQHGSVYWSAASGAHVIDGPVQVKWAAIGAERGVLGYPTKDVGPTGDGIGTFARFQGGAIYATPSTGARVMLGPVETLWNATGAERGPLGYPTQSVSWAADHVGQYARFQHGSIFWSPSTGAHSVVGPYLTVWAATGYEHGYLGYPIGEPYAVNGGHWQKFQHGYIAHSTATGKTWAVHQ